MTARGWVAARVNRLNPLRAAASCETVEYATTDGQVSQVSVLIDLRRRRHRKRMIERRARQKSRQSRAHISDTPKVKYTGAWLRARRAERGVGRPLQ